MNYYSKNTVNMFSLVIVVTFLMKLR